MSKTIFITGASTGLGKATALLFADKGWTVIASMRKPEDGKDLVERGITVFKLDVTEPAEIKEVAAKVTSMGVDVVFNNAGFGQVGPLEGTSEEQIEKQFDTNLLGVIRVTQAFIPYFREYRKGLFITTTSIGGLIALPYNSLYHATKWALEGWSESMAFELNPFGIGIKTVSPGGISTDFVSRSLSQASHPAYDSEVAKVWKAFSDPERASQGSSAEQIAAVVYEAATDGKSQLRYLAGEDAKALYADRLARGAEASRETLRGIFLKD